jgi:hypothetical protein
MALETIIFAFIVFALFSFSFFALYIPEWEERSWFLDVKDWKYTNILQQLNLRHHHSSMEDIRVGWHYHTKQRKQQTFYHKKKLRILTVYLSAWRNFGNVFVTLTVRKAAEWGIWMLFGQCNANYSWGGLTNNPALYNEKFLFENYESICSLKIIWPKSTPLCQPCNVSFYRQVKKLHCKFSDLPIFHSR